jgi:hypothetical protein
MDRSCSKIVSLLLSRHFQLHGKHTSFPVHYKSWAFTIKYYRFVIYRFCSRLMCLSKPVKVTDNKKYSSLPPCLSFSIHYKSVMFYNTCCSMFLSIGPWWVNYSLSQFLFYIILCLCYEEMQLNHRHQIKRLQWLVQNIEI